MLTAWPLRSTTHLDLSYVVCLYSENRKFFLHGELYCAVATAIGKNGKSAPEIFRELSKTFPADKIEEAIKRLLERRYVVAGASTTFDGAVAGYWASLGLPLEVAEQNRRNCPVRVEAIDVKGADALAAALGKLGVQIAKRSPKLTITLVNDYLDRRLAEMNRERVAEQDAVAAGAAVRRISAGGPGVQARARARAGTVCSTA